MKTSTRTFAAIPINSADSIREQLDNLQACEGLRAVRPETLHITLKFFGDTPQQSIDSIVAVMEEQTSRVRTTQIRLGGLDAFPNQSHPSVIWARCAPTEPIRELAALIDAAAQRIGFAREVRGYTPHLTLALQRPRNASVSPRVLELLGKHATTDLGSFELNQAVLYESKLANSGPTYRAIAKFPFGPSAPVD